MKLEKIRIKNFRCYKRDTDFILDDLTAIIGKNDIGKSTVLEAIDAFFNETIEQSDLSVNIDGNSIEITCFFSGLPDQIVLDTSVATSPINEGILSSDGKLQVKKVFSFGGRKSIATYLIANHPSDERLSNLLSLKNSSLKTLAEQLGVELNGVNVKQNPALRQAIRNYIGGERAEKVIKVDGSLDTEDNLKSIWGSLKKLLPVFSLFKSDKSFDDKDGDIKDPLQAAINEALALNEIQNLISQIEDKVKEFSTQIADKTIEKLKAFDENLSEKLKSEFSKSPNYNKIFDLTLLNEENIPLNKRGSGIRRLVILSFFQAQAERRRTESNAPSIIYAIEEPETSQHPNHQKMIIEALADLSAQENVQVIFTTHSANLVREIPVRSLRFITTGENGTPQIEYGYNFQNQDTDEIVIDKIIKTLGILPNPSDHIKVLLFVEGNHDVNAIKRYSRIIHRHDNSIFDLTSTNTVGYVITGGSALKHYVEQRHLDGLGKPQLHIYDNDVDDNKTMVARINAENNPKKLAINTAKLELENYLHHDAILEAYNENGSRLTNLRPILDEDDVPLLVAECFSPSTWGQLADEKKKELASNKKKFLNTFAVEKMSVERLQERNGFDEIKGWLIEIEKLSRLV